VRQRQGVCVSEWSGVGRVYLIDEDGRDACGLGDWSRSRARGI
jgi:hypothetical protein